MQRDDGFGFMFENLETNKLLLAKIVLNIENLVE